MVIILLDLTEQSPADRGFQGLVERPIAVEMKFTKELQPPHIGIVDRSLQSHERVRVLADCSDQIIEATRGPRIIVDKDIEP